MLPFVKHPLLVRVLVIHGDEDGRLLYLGENLSEVQDFVSYVYIRSRNDFCDPPMDERFYVFEIPCQYVFVVVFCLKARSQERRL